MNVFRIIFVSTAVLFFARNGTHLNMINVGAPAINCIFETDCTIIGNDTSAPIPYDDKGGGGFLQSRTFPAGESGTTGEGLICYLYRIDMRNTYGITHINCVLDLSLDFGPRTRLDARVPDFAP